MTLRRLALLALGAWIARWAAAEIASLLGHRLPPGPPPKDSPRPPGWMPGPFTHEKP